MSRNLRVFKKAEERCQCTVQTKEQSFQQAFQQLQSARGGRWWLAENRAREEGIRAAAGMGKDFEPDHHG